MPRRKQHDRINEYHREEVRRKIWALTTAISNASLSLNFFCPHGQALADLRAAAVRAENLIYDRPGDYQPPGNSTPGPVISRPETGP